MKKLLFTFLLLTSLGHAFAQDFESVKITSEHIRGSVHVLFGMGGNIGVLAGEDGVLMVDNQFAPLSKKIRKAIAKIQDGEIVYNINTHFHYDHSDGNKAFGPEGSVIIAHENARTRMMTEQTIVVPGSEPYLQKAYEKTALPTITLDQSTRLHLNGESIYLFHVKNAHTDTDVITYFREANVIHTGDVFVRYGIPFIDQPNGGSVKGMISAANEILSICDEETVIIPGHGQLSKKEDVLAFQAMIQGIWDKVTLAKSAGSSLEQIIESDLTKGLTGMSGSHLVKLIYGELDEPEEP